MTTDTGNEKKNREQQSLDRLLDLLASYTSSVLTDQLLAEATGGELTPSQLQALTFIHRHGGCSVKGLSEGLRISIPSATRLVDRLVRKQLVTRCENAVDRRLVILAATPSGESALSNVRAAHLARLHLALSTFSCDDQARLLELLERFLLAALSDVASVQECCRRCGTEHNGACVVNEAHMALLGRPIEGT